MHSEGKKVRENGLWSQTDWGSSLHFDISNLVLESHLIQANFFFFSIKLCECTRQQGKDAEKKIHFCGAYSLINQTNIK